MGEIKAYKRTLGELKEAFQYGKFHIIRKIDPDGALRVSRMYYIKETQSIRIQETLKRVELKGLNGFAPKVGDYIFTDSSGVPSIMRPNVTEEDLGMKIVDFGTSDTPEGSGGACGAS